MQYSQGTTMARAFTLIELLVVVTIIVVLLALLTPALDKAIYQAELVACAGKQKALAAATFDYAMRERRFYPYRAIIENGGKGDGQSQPILLHRQPDDEIGLLSRFLILNTHLQDPLVKAVDLTRVGGAATFKTPQNGVEPNVSVYSSIAYWAGWRYTVPPAAVGGTGVSDPVSSGAPQKGMRKLGDAFEWDGNRYRMVVSDHDAISPSHGVQSKHPDLEGVMYNLVLQEAVAPWDSTSALGLSATPITLSTWTAAGQVWRRGPIDMNAAFDDGAVLRYNTVAPDPALVNDDRMAKVPVFSNALNWSGGSDYWLNVPRSDR